MSRSIQSRIVGIILIAFILIHRGLGKDRVWRQLGMRGAEITPHPSEFIAQPRSDHGRASIFH